MWEVPAQYCCDDCKAKIKEKKKKAVQTKQGFSAVQINYGKCLKFVCSRKVHCAVTSSFNLLKG